MNLKKWALRALLALFVTLIVAVAIGYRKIQPSANIGAGYVAHQVCSCVFVARRSHESCLLDMLPMMDPIRSEIIAIEGKQGVHASLPLLADRTALHTPGFGCALD